MRHLRHRRGAVNVEAAEALGMRGLLFEDNARTMADIERYLAGDA
ncbi:hypothetical protein [Streptomyces sp. WMMB 322]|nr:hypothetical protein [Streptomyces sp. WMMB 322]